MVIPFGFDCEGKLGDAFRLSFLFLDGAGWGIAPTLANGMVTQGRKENCEGFWRDLLGFS
jgi:hypothetical protein